MGWLEVLAMLKRLLPLLTRVAPMLESYVGGRVAGRDDTAAFERIAGELKQDLISTTAAHRTEVEAALAEQSGHLRELAEELRRLRVAEEERAAALAEVQQRLAAVQGSLKLLTVGVVLILVAIGAAVVVLRH
jgi:CHASE3 domain sensor protein